MSLFPFSRLGEVASERRDALRSIVAARRVAKDPLFSWTLPVWVKAGVDVEYVTISTRTIDEAYGSHSAAAHMHFKSANDGKNSLIYGLGLTIATCLDAAIPFGMVRFPDMLSDPVELYRGLRFPDAVSFERFCEVFEEVVDRNLVHQYDNEHRHRLE